MTLREVTREAISLVKNASGCPVVVSEDNSPKTFCLPRGSCLVTRRENP